MMTTNNSLSKERTFLEVIYQSLMTPASIAAAPLFYLSSRGRIKLKERYGQWEPLPKEVTWVHGASLGETRGLLPVIEKIRPHSPPLLFTATSATGLERVKGFVDTANLLPFDSPVWLSQALKGTQVRLFIATETELWPSLTYTLAMKNVPLFLINARISEYTYPRYQKVPRLVKSILDRYSKILVGDKLSYERFLGLGADKSKLILTGSTKYDVAPKLTLPVDSQILKERWWDPERTVVTLGSLRPGEEESWFPAMKTVQAQYPQLSFVIAPRHNEKSKFFMDSLKALGLEFECLSTVLSSGSRCKKNILFLDQSGWLEDAYAMSSLAFIGATLVDIGGHNPLEACAYGTPVSVGPFHSVIKEIVAELNEKTACFEVKDQSSVESVLISLCNDPQKFKEAGDRAFDVWRGFQGATEKVVNELLPILEKRG